MAKESSTGGEEKELYSNMSISKAQSLGTDKVNEIIKKFNLGNLGKIDENTNKDVEDYVDNTITSASDLINKFGTRQEVIIVGSNDTPLLKAQRILNDNCLPKEDITVEVLGDLSYRIGWGVHVVLDFLPTNYKDCFMYIKDFKHTWKAKGQFTTELTLTPSRVMDTKEWTDIDEANSSSDSNSNSSSASVEKAVTWAIGIANDDTHGYSQDINKRFAGIDYDCSSFVISAFEQAGIPLKTNGATYTGDMKKVCLNTGFEEVSWGNNVNSLRRGDILLNEEHHVALYIGDGKLVHASSDRGHPEYGDQDGTEVYVTNYYNRPWDCVLRYKIIVSDFNGTIESGGYSSEYVELVKSFEGYYDHWYADSNGVQTIGYGIAVTGDVGKRLKTQGVTSCTKEEATGWLKEELNYWADVVTKRITSKGYSMSQYCFDVSVDICYQWGNQKLNIIDMLGNGDIESAKSAILSLNYPRRDKIRVNMLEGDYTPPK